ncbi:hypothetical protein SADUNF_Sadunf17G0115600 [Salix dunnii]|uniref:Uncharacterized protein n=1 Tax=Salix dunnii TaxID=1413687 RepID=A0A835J970_9ROSI|nr:hypothetical protein SADUNF_Sadunf17G0115600 [Salix dunnii]
MLISLSSSPSLEEGKIILGSHSRKRKKGGVWKAKGEEGLREREGWDLLGGTMAGSLGVRKGAWTEEEDILLRKCVQKYGEGRWHQIPSIAGLNRCRKSCRMRWLNYLKPDIKRGLFSVDEVDMIIRLHKLLGNRQVEMSFSQSYILLRGKSTPPINVGSQYGNDLGKPCYTTASPTADYYEFESLLWETLLDDKERNLTINNSCLGSASAAANLETNESLFAESNLPGGMKIGDALYEQAQNCWSDISFDADPWNLIDTELDQ